MTIVCLWQPFHFTGGILKINGFCTDAVYCQDWCSSKWKEVTLVVQDAVYPYRLFLTDFFSLLISLYFFFVPFIIIPDRPLYLKARNHFLLSVLFKSFCFSLPIMGMLFLNNYSPASVLWLKKYFFFHLFFLWYYHLLPASSRHGGLVVASVQKAWTAACNDKRCLLGRWVHFKCWVMFQAAQQRSCASYGHIRRAWCWCAAAWEAHP